MTQPTVITTARGLCLDCNYSLEGIDSRRCPECGRMFDPADVDTMNMSRPITWAERQILKPTKALYPVALLAIAALTALCIWTIPWTPMGLVYSCFALSIGSFIVVALFVARALLRNLVVRHHGLPETFVRADDRVHRKLYRALAIATLLLLTRLPFWVLFFVNLPFLSRVATHEYGERPHDAPRPHNVWVGVLPIDVINVAPEGVTFQLSRGLCLYYYPKGPGRDKHRIRQWFFGDWYLEDS
jgi:hypothetical protein